MNINNIFSLIEKKHLNAISNNINNLKIKNLIDLNNLLYLELILIKKYNPNLNLLEKKTLEEYGIETNEDLTLLAPINWNKKDFMYDVYYPYSMRQAHFLYKNGLNKDILTKFYNFSFEEIKEGISIKKGLKIEFYPFSHEDNQEGIYHFNKDIIGLPEFISEIAINKYLK
jgi:hypothetical protein